MACMSLGLEPLEHPRVARREQGQIGLLLVLHQGLLQPASLGQHLLSGVDDAVLQAQEQVGVPQTEVRVKNHGLGALASKGDPKVGRGRCFSNTAFARTDEDGSGRRHQGSALVRPE